MVEEYLKRGCSVIATARASSTDKLLQLAQKHPESLEVETADITIPQQAEELYVRLSNRHIHPLFVNAGAKNADHATVVEVSTEEFIRVIVTNALSPMRFIKKFEDLVIPGGTIGVMSSGQGSVSNNTKGHFEVYRSSKAALNMFMRSYAASHSEDNRTLLLMTPGWVKTDIGGSDAPLTIEESIPALLNMMDNYEGRSGLHYLDYPGKMVPW